MKTLDYLIKKYNLDTSQKSPKSPIEIPGVGRLDLLRWLRELDFKTGVEVGVEQGRYAELICEMNTQMKVWGVDPYLKYEGYREYPDQKWMDGLYEVMLEKMKSYIDDNQFKIIRKKSEDALADFADESLDFVYIDANHEFDYPLRDIEGWWPKVKKNGILAGHDFVRVNTWNFTIKDALKEFTEERNIPYFVLGLYKKERGVVRDRSRSWMIIK